MQSHGTTVALKTAHGGMDVEGWMCTRKHVQGVVWSFLSLSLITCTQDYVHILGAPQAQRERYERLAQKTLRGLGGYPSTSSGTQKASLTSSKDGEPLALTARRGNDQSKSGGVLSRSGEFQRGRGRERGTGRGRDGDRGRRGAVRGAERGREAFSGFQKGRGAIGDRGLDWN